MGDLRVSLAVTKVAPRKWCAVAHAGQVDDTTSVVGPEAGVQGSPGCGSQRSVAIARALTDLAKQIKTTRPFGALKRRKP